MSTDGLTRRAVLHAAVSFGALAALSGCVATPGSAQLRIACGEPGGTYIRFGKLLADVAVRAGIADRVTALTTDGSIQNLGMLASGEADLGLSLADSAADDRSGLVALGRMYQNYLQCIVRAISPIRNSSDLRNRHISIGAPGSGTAQTARRTLTALGLIPDHVGQPETPILQLNLADAADALAAGEIDALMWSGGIPAPEIDALRARTPIRLLDLSDATSALNASYGGVYQHTLVPAGVYDLDTDVPSIGVPNFLLCRDSLPDQTAARLVDLFIDNARELVPEPSAGVQYLTQANLIDTSPISLHPAAAERYAARYG